MVRSLVAAAFAAFFMAGSAVATVALAQDVKLTPEVLRNPATIASGREVWEERCFFCHGKTAYPGKAPKLDPSRYQPEFVFDRVYNGFKGMPSWKEEFSVEQLIGVTAYVMSPDFSN